MVVVKQRVVGYQVGLQLGAGLCEHLFGLMGVVWGARVVALFDEWGAMCCSGCMTMATSGFKFG